MKRLEIQRVESVKLLLSRNTDQIADAPLVTFGDVGLKPILLL